MSHKFFDHSWSICNAILQGPGSWSHDWFWSFFKKPCHPCCKNLLFHIRQLRLFRRSLTPDALHILVRALIHAPKFLINKLNSVLRTAARLVLGLPVSASLSHLMHHKLHWLPVRQRILFKLCSLSYKCIHDTAPVYLSKMCIRVSTVGGRSQLRSSTSGRLLVPTTSTKTIGRRGFFYSGPKAWNTLPPQTIDRNLSLHTFKKQLKTFLFGQQSATQRHWETFV